ncbi:PQQ-binding-like beta-propeller repeat protein [Ruania zhangjianzhongii]|uniref:outer membrane protein assembly factor BamB family protein n=1 Tax=Ruania zhangjianzhongii TaxID=2603206 RepID=UPI0011C78263|nr:PQQ-binding-like beta-propeller repeat protein [Ruania zhangjianzhongii]
MSISRIRNQHRLIRSTVVTAAGLGLALLATACGTEGQDPGGGDAAAGGSDSDGSADSDGGADPSQDPTQPSVELGDWVEVPAGAIVVASTPGTAVLAVGEPENSDDGTTRDVAAYDAAGEELWTYPGVIEDYYEPTTLATEAGVAVLTPDGDSSALTMLDWASGEELWSLSAEDLGGCDPWRFSALPAAEVVSMTSDGPPCAGTEPDRAGVITLDAASGEVREEHLPSAGTVQTTDALATDEVWSAEVTDEALTVQRFDPASGEVDAREIGWQVPAAEELRPENENEELRVSQVTADLAILQLWGTEGVSASALLDWTSEDDPETLLQPADDVAPCFGDGLAAPDAAVDGCLRVDLSTEDAPVQSLGFDGEERWSVPGQSGLDMEVPAQVDPIPAGERNAWVVSTGDDLLTALDAQTGEELWVAGDGEGAGFLTLGHVSEAGVLTAVVTSPDGPQGQLLRIDTSTGEEIDRQDVTAGWLSSTDSAAVLSSQNEEQPSLLTVAQGS